MYIDIHIYVYDYNHTYMHQLQNEIAAKKRMKKPGPIHPAGAVGQVISTATGSR